MFFRRADGLAALSPATALLAVEVADTSLAYDLDRKTRIYRRRRRARGVGDRGEEPDHPHPPRRRHRRLSRAAHRRAGRDAGDVLCPGARSCGLAAWSWCKRQRPSGGHGRSRGTQACLLARSPFSLPSRPHACRCHPMRRRLQRLSRRHQPRGRGPGRLARGDRRRLCRRYPGWRGAGVRPPPRGTFQTTFEQYADDPRHRQPHQPRQAASGPPRRPLRPHRAALRVPRELLVAVLAGWRATSAAATWATWPGATRHAGPRLPAHRAVPARAARGAADRPARRPAVARHGRRVAGELAADPIPAVVLHQVRRRLSTATAMSTCATACPTCWPPPPTCCARHGWQAGAPFGEGTANFAQVMREWNRAVVYRKTMVLFAERLQAAPDPPAFSANAERALRGLRLEPPLRPCRRFRRGATWITLDLDLSSLPFAAPCPRDGGQLDVAVGRRASVKLY